jgi:hypothetical protein
LVAKDPVILELCSQSQFEKAIEKADRRIKREKKLKEKLKSSETTDEKLESSETTDENK